MNVKKKIVSLLFVSIVFSLSALPVRADRTGDQGIGLMVGVPSGFSWKMFLSDDLALDGALGVERSELDVHLDMLWHNYQWAKNVQGLERITSRGDLPVYLGMGPRILFEDKSEFGIRIPVGIAFLPHQTNWEFFGEFAPVFRMTPNSGINGNISVGARYYFPSVRPRSDSK